ncbi:MAG: hypothetical protein KC731_31845 [Myxococcales bacterium]|nr:hypothetical protein [Myxococcales bacterium]
MKNITILLSLTSLLATACIGIEGDDTAQSRDAVACNTDADCATGEECEVEDNGSFCKAHDSNDDGQGGAGAGGNSDTSSCTTDADCAAGEECELEHGVSFCKPHGGEGGEDGVGGDDGGVGGDDGNGGGTTCLTDADCPAGEECEIQPDGSFCKPHGGA